MTDLVERRKGNSRLHWNQDQQKIEVAGDTTESLRSEITRLQSADVKRVEDICRLTRERDEAREALSEAQAQGEVMREALEKIGARVESQAEDHGLWFKAATCAEAYLQQELRILHAEVEAALSSTSPTAVARVIEAARELEPHLDGLICYASTTSEHEPNRLVLNLRNALASLDGRKG